MSDSEQRKFERKDSLNILDYVILSDEGDPIDNGMGRTRNISEIGLLLETPNPLSIGQTILITVGLKEDMVELKGKVTHTKLYAEKMFCSGIEFMEIDENGKRVLNNFLEALKNSEDN